jgi:signal transduction histidine kinase
MDTEIIIAIIAATTLFILLAGFIVVFVFFYNKKKQLHFKELEEQKKLFEQEVLVSRLEIKEQTLLDIAQEIHDNVGQVMLLAKLNLNKILMAGNNEPIEEIRDLMSQAIVDLRDISKSLHTQQIVAVDLKTAVEREVQRLKKTGLADVNFNIIGIPQIIESSRKLILIRMLQEILQNILKHSKSSFVKIEIQFQAEFLTLDIKDNGIGFNITNIEEGDSEKGAGLLNLYQRSKVLKATLSINSKPNEGTTINIKMPL